jgi:hypothetical protein
VSISKRIILCQDLYAMANTYHQSDPAWGRAVAIPTKEFGEMESDSTQKLIRGGRSIASSVFDTERAGLGDITVGGDRVEVSTPTN